MKDKGRKFLKIFFFLYVGLIINFIVFKFWGNIDDLFNTIQLNYDRVESGTTTLINLIPFRTIMLDIQYNLKHVILNIIVFIPIGFLLPIVFPARNKFLKSLIIFLIMIIGIELIQRISYLGIFDIDDIFLNIIGCLIGYASFLVFDLVVIRERNNQY